MGIEIGVLAGWLGTAVLLGAAGTGAAMSMSSSAQEATAAKNAAEDQAGAERALLGGVEPLPSPDTALADAQGQADARRRMILASGGATNPTGSGGAILNPTQVQTKTLLGS